MLAPHHIFATIITNKASLDNLLSALEIDLGSFCYILPSIWASDASMANSIVKHTGESSMGSSSTSGFNSIPLRRKYNPNLSSASKASGISVNVP